MSLVIKIGRYDYVITESDRFMNNGRCIQLMTQGKESFGYGQMKVPKLSKLAEKEISKYERKSHPHSHGSNVEFFSLVLSG